MSTNTPYRALLIDLDGVLRLWPSSDCDYETPYALPSGAIRAVAFEPNLLLDVVEGRISDEVWRQRVAMQLSLVYPDAQVSDAVNTWSALSGVVNEPVVKLVRHARQKTQVVLVTNATSRLNRDLVDLDLLQCFDAVINSSEVGSSKPKMAIFEAALSAVGVSPSEALFVDDQLANVMAATELGILATQYTSAAQLSAFLKQSQILDRAP